MKISKLIRNLIAYLLTVTVIFIAVSAINFYTAALNSKYVQIYTDTTMFPKAVEELTTLFLTDAQTYAKTGDKAYLESATKTLTVDLAALEESFEVYPYKANLDE